MFAPNRIISAATAQMIVIVQLVAFLLIWITLPYDLLPKPTEVLAALNKLWFEDGLSRELWSSFSLNLEALLLSTGISLLMSYATVMPFFRPIVAAISKGRFLSLAGFTFVLTGLLHFEGHGLKLALMVIGMTVFYLTSMASVIEAIPKADFDHARTCGMGEWRVVWEVVILGTVDKAFEVMRQNAAIGWMMLTMVEGISRAEGGVGVALLNNSKYMRLDAVFAIQMLILVVGLFQDYVIGVVRATVCPYADLTLERS